MSNPFEIIESRLSNIENLLLDLKHLPKVPEPIPDETGIEGAMEETGLKRSTLYKGSWNGSIPCRKRGKRLLYSRKELRRWNQERTVRKTSPEHTASEELATQVNMRLNKSTSVNNQLQK